MKKIILSIFIIVALFSLNLAQGVNGKAIPANTSGNFTVIKNALLKLEAHIKWTAVSNQWKSERTSWINNVRFSQSPEDLCRLLIKLESNIKWAAVSSKWKNIRDEWIDKCRNSRDVQQVAQLLIKLESNIKWAAVSIQWRNLRRGWINRLKKPQSLVL